MSRPRPLADGAGVPRDRGPLTPRLTQNGGGGRRKARQLLGEVRPIRPGVLPVHGPDESHGSRGWDRTPGRGHSRPRRGAGPFVPGRPGERGRSGGFTSDDPDEQMHQGDDPQAAQARAGRLLRRWIEEGARWIDGRSRCPRGRLYRRQGDSWTRKRRSIGSCSRWRRPRVGRRPEAERNGHGPPGGALTMTGLPPSSRGGRRVLADDSARRIRADRRPAPAIAAVGSVGRYGSTWPSSQTPRATRRTAGATRTGDIGGTG